MELSLKEIQDNNTKINSIVVGEVKGVIEGADIQKYYSTPLNAGKIVTIIRALENKKLNPTLGLIQGIRNVSSQEHLVVIALSIRYGANVNAYVKSNNIGDIHILAYLEALKFEELIPGSSREDNSYYLDILTMLLLSGSDSRRPVFKPSNTTSDTQNVDDWLNDNGYPHNYNLQTVLFNESINKAIIFLDRKDTSIDFTVEKNQQLAFDSYANNILDDIKLPLLTVGLDYPVLRQSFERINVFLFGKVISTGILPSYYLTNRIITSILQSAPREIVVSREYQSMLIISVQNGLNIDLEQRSLLLRTEKKFLGQIKKDYTQPYWKKVCSNNGVIVPLRIQQLLFHLGMDYNLNKKVLCRVFRQISQAQPEKIKEAAIYKQRLILASNLGYINEFINKKIPVIVCKNRKELTYNPLEYSNNNVGYYRDEKGSTWCFLSSVFPDLISNPINSYNGQVLPEDFITKIGMKRAISVSLEIKTPLTITEAIESSKKPDEFSDSLSEKIYNQFLVILAQNGYSSTILEGLSKSELKEIFDTLGYPLPVQIMTIRYLILNITYLGVYFSSNEPDTLATMLELLNTS